MGLAKGVIKIGKDLFAKGSKEAQEADIAKGGRFEIEYQRSKDIEYVQREFASHKWGSEEEAKAAIRRSREHQNNQFSGIFGKELDVTVGDHLEFSKVGGKVRIKQPPKQREGLVMADPDTPMSDAPAVNWGAKDNFSFDEVGMGGKVKRGWAAIDDLPLKKIERHEGILRKETPPEEFSQNMGGFPPIKILINKNKTMSLVDGHHRLSWFKDQGYANVPVEVVDHSASGDALRKIKDSIKGKDKVGALGAFGAAIGSFLIEDAGADHYPDSAVPEYVEFKKDIVERFYRTMKDIMPEARLEWGDIAHQQSRGDNFVAGSWNRKDKILRMNYVGQKRDAETGEEWLSPFSEKFAGDYMAGNYNHEMYHALTTAGVISEDDENVLLAGAERLGYTNELAEGYRASHHKEELAARMFERYLSGYEPFTAEEMEILGTATEFQVQLIESFFGDSKIMNTQTPLDVLEKIYKQTE